MKLENGHESRSSCRLFIPFMQCLNYQCLPFRCGGNVFIIFFPEMCQVNKAKMYTDENKLRVKLQSQ